MDQNTPPKSDALSSQVLEYFRKHSGNQNLSSYLRGIVPQQESKVKSEIDINTLVDGQNLILESDDKGKIDQKNDRDINISPTSSLMSNRKLEWDNGADIGYENTNSVNLHKSFSLPILTTLEKIELGKTPLKSPLEGNEVSSVQAYCPSNGSGIDLSVKACLASTTSSSCTPEEQKLDTTTSLSFAFNPLSSEIPSEVGSGKESIIKLVHRKVGSPVAQSTPNTERPAYNKGIFADIPVLSEERDKVSTIATDAAGTPFRKSEDNKMHITELKCVAKFTKSKIVRLAVTKPILVDCINYKKYDNKDSQTAKNIEFASVGVQTEQTKPDTTGRKENSQNIPLDEEKQFIEYIKYSDSDEQPGSRSIGTNTVSDLVSNCNSFEYLCPTDTDDKATSDKVNLGELNCEVKKTNLGNLTSNEHFGNPKSSDNQYGSNKSSSNSNTTHLNDINSDNSEKSLSSNVTEVSSKSMPLGEMISCNLSKHLKVDIDKSIFLLQRLLKSKRYDKVTKDYFVKKIVEKILKSNYSSDSSSSLNKDKERKENEVFYQEGGSSTSSKVSEKLLEPSLKKRLQENVPWTPVTFNKDVRKSNKLEVKTFSTDIFPEDKEKRKVKDSRFTITSSILDHQQPKETNIPGYFKMSGHKLPLGTSTAQSSQDENRPQKSAMKNWKDDITRSEKLFETGCLKFDGDKTDSLVRFAKKERTNQLNWINDEISHLNKLKNLLQENNYSEMGNNKATSKTEKPNIEIKVLTKPHVEDMKKMKKSTSVYVITTDRTTSDDGNNRPKAAARLGSCPAAKNLTCKGKVFNVTSELRDAKLVSSEVYESNKPYTCVRRYVFEIPVQCTCDTLPCKHEHDDNKKPSILRTSDQDYETSSVVFDEPDDILPGETNSEQPAMIREVYIEPDNITEKSSLNNEYLPRIPSNKREPDKFSRGSQVSAAEFEERKRRVHSVTAAPYLPLAPSNAVPKQMPFNSKDYDNLEKFSRSTQASATEFVDNKRKVQSLEEVPYLPPTARNVIASQSAPVSSRCKSVELTNVVLNEGMLDNEVSVGVNTEERYRQPSVEFQGLKYPLVEYERLSIETQEPATTRKLSWSATDNQKTSSDYREPSVPAPDYQKPAVNYQTRDPNYQSPPPDYQRPAPNYQMPDSAYQRVNPMHQGPPPDFQQVAAEQQRRIPDFQTVEPNYQNPTVYQKRAPNGQKPGVGGQRPSPDNQVPNYDYQRFTPVYQRSAAGQRTPPDPNYQRNAPDYQKPASDYQNPPPNYQRPGTDYQIPDPNYHKAIPAYQKPASNYQEIVSDVYNPATDYQNPRADFETLDPNYQRFPVSRQRPAADYQRSSIDQQIPNSDYQKHNSAYEKPTNSYQKPTSDFQRPATDYQTVDDYQTPDPDCQRRMSYSQKPISDYQKPPDDYQNYTRAYQRSTSDRQKPLIYYQKPASDYRRPSTDYETVDPDYERPASVNQRPPTDYQKSIGDYQKPAPNYKSPTTDYEVPDPHYQRVHSTNKTAPDRQKPPIDYQQSSDYEKSDGDHQTPDPNYQKNVSDYQRPGAEYETPDFEYQGPAADYQGSAPPRQTPAQDYPKPGPSQPSTQSEHKRNITPTSSASSTSTSSSSQTILIRICPCCKRKKSKYKSVLQGLPNEIENSLCRPCHRNTTMAIDPTTGQYKTYPEHVCNCYTLMKTETVNKIKQTVKQLEELENEEMCCNCSHKRCKCPGFGRSKKGIAYTLTLEDDDASESSEQDVHRKRSLDEIKLKIPDKKKHRSKSQHKGHHRKHHRKHKKDQSPSKMTLQEYLCANRPNFVQNAEERRKTLIELAYMRERRCQKYKQLLAMTNGILPVNYGDQAKKKGLYTTKEMKKITAKNYKKLPEVQKKLEERRENDNKKANKLLADIFNKKLQQNALKGKVDMSTTASVIKFI